MESLKTKQARQALGKISSFHGEQWLNAFSLRELPSLLEKSSVQELINATQQNTSTVYKFAESLATDENNKRLFEKSIKLMAQSAATSNSGLFYKGIYQNGSNIDNKEYSKVKAFLFAAKDTDIADDVEDIHRSDKKFRRKKHLHIFEKLQSTNLLNVLKVFVALILWEYAQMKKEAEQADKNRNYNKLETEHFNVTYPKDEEKRCKEIAKQLEVGYSKVTRDLKVSVNKKTKVNLFKTKDDFHKSIGCYGAPEYSWMKGTAEDGIIKTHLELPTKDLMQLVIHEFTHIAVENLNNGAVPFILNDGIAMYEAGQSDYQKILTQIPITRLPDTLDNIIESMRSARPDISYALAYSFVEFVISKYSYDKIIKLLKVNYQSGKVNYEEYQYIYSEWRSSIIGSAKS